MGSAGSKTPFRRVKSLRVNALGWDDYRASFVPLHGFSPILKSLTLTHASIFLSEAFNLICSFPLLEDLGLLIVGPNSDTDGWNSPPASPKLTGSLMIVGGIHPVARRLCDLPGGLRFSNIRITCINEEPTSATDLVSKCSNTLEPLTVAYYSSGAFVSAPVISQHLTTVLERRRF